MSQNLAQTDPAAMRLAQALIEVLGGTRDQLPPIVDSSRYVTIALAAAKTGLSEKAIRRKIEDGVWIEDLQYRRAPDGHVMIDIKGVEAWVEKGAASKSAKVASGSRSSTMGKSAASA